MFTVYFIDDNTTRIFYEGIELKKFNSWTMDAFNSGRMGTITIDGYVEVVNGSPEFDEDGNLIEYQSEEEIMEALLDRDIMGFYEFACDSCDENCIGKTYSPGNFCDRFLSNNHDWYPCDEIL
jgi:hypothetical protein